MTKRLSGPAKNLHDAGLPSPEARFAAALERAGTRMTVSELKRATGLDDAGVSRAARNLRLLGNFVDAKAPILKRWGRPRIQYKLQRPVDDLLADLEERGRTREK